MPMLSIAIDGTSMPEKSVTRPRRRSAAGRPAFDEGLFPPLDELTVVRQGPGLCVDPRRTGAGERGPASSAFSRQIVTGLALRAGLPAARGGRSA